MPSSVWTGSCLETWVLIHLSQGKECIGNTTSVCVLKQTLPAYFQISRRQCFVNTMTPKKQLQGFQRKGDGGWGHGGSLLGTITNWFFCYLSYGIFFNLSGRRWRDIIILLSEIATAKCALKLNWCNMFWSGWLVEE